MKPTTLQPLFRAVLPALAMVAAVVAVWVACGPEVSPAPTATTAAIPTAPVTEPAPSATPPPVPATATPAPTSEPTATPEPAAPVVATPATLAPPPVQPAIFGGPHESPDARVSPSIDEQIYRSNVIVRASLQSATAGAETIAGEGDDAASTYLAVHELRFVAHEYMKGSGPDEVLALVRGDSRHETELDALAEAKDGLAQRNSTWDGQQGVLFLMGPYTRSDTAATVYVFPVYNWQESPWDYSVANLSRAWLPIEGSVAVTTVETAAPLPGAAAVLAGPAKANTDDEVETTPEPELLVDLRSNIAEFDTTLKAGAKTQGYNDCIASKIQRERSRRADTWSPWEEGKTIASGSAAGIEISSRDGHQQDTGYSTFWVSGPDAEMFQTMVVDDDNAPENGYRRTLNTARPLPTGEYRVHNNSLLYIRIPCNFVPLDAYGIWTVTAEAPTGSMHEAFFDPAAMGDAVGADDDDGVLEPASFTVGETYVTINEVSWELEKATVELSNSASLADHHLDAIALDGSVSLRLDFDDTTATDGDGGAKVYTWGVCAQPWVAGDLLMLRLSESGATLTGATNDASCGE